MSVDLLLHIAAFVLFVAAALGVSVNRVNLLAAGLACWVLTAIL